MDESTSREDVALAEPARAGAAAVSPARGKPPPDRPRQRREASRADDLRERAVLAATLAGLVAGAAAWLAGAGGTADALWGVTTAVALVPLVLGVARELLGGRLGVDVVALLSMAGTLLVGEYLAGAVVAVMLAGGNVLEGLAAGRARRELSALASRAPREAHRYGPGGIEPVPLAAVREGDRLLVRSGEIVPVDGAVAGVAGAVAAAAGGRGAAPGGGDPPGQDAAAGAAAGEGAVALLDESALTGEPLPVARHAGEPVRSGVVNAGPAFELRATATAEASTYAAIVRLVEMAQASRAPLVRLADRWAVAFLVVTAAAAILAWGLSGDAVRAVAVLVVATPCPLILATPVAILSGVSRAARRGVLVKGGGALEALARARLLAIDKTGTVTGGAPELAEVVPVAPWSADEVLRLAASVDSASVHVLAATLVRTARARGLELEPPTATQEELGAGITGRVGSRAVAVGQASWVLAGRPLGDEAARLRERAAEAGEAAVFVAVDGALAGVLLFADPLRPEAAQTIAALRAAGFARVVLLTGDHREAAEAVGAALGVDDVVAEQTPAGKVETVRALVAAGVTVMVGDGINDAPALAAADVGVALGARGASASSEAADVVLVADRLDRLAEAVAIARRSRGIALQSIGAGMGLSLAGMTAAAFGLLPPVAGALLQEAIDVAVILNALRALGGGAQPAA